MRFIDEKGRLFGRMNIFDLFVLCAIVLTMVFIVQWAKRADDPSWVKVRLTHVRCIGIMQAPSYMAGLVKEGDEMADANNAIMVRITKILSDEAHPAATYVSKDGEKLFFNNELRDIAVEIEISAYEKKGEVYSAITNEPLRIGLGVVMATKKYTIAMIVRKILGSEGAE